MQKIICLSLSMIICFSLVACGGPINLTNDLVNDNKTSTTDENNKNAKEEKKGITEEELNTQLSEQEVKIISSKYTVQDEEHKTLYPDMLQVTIKNDTQYDIKNAVIAFVAWDKNNLPVKILGSMDFSDGSYIKRVNYGDINLVPGATFGEKSGFEIDESCEIASFKAIVVSYETFTGEEWNNPLYNDWCELYEGVKLSAK